jgi:glucose-6-phosphate 1-dehydrogenase
MSKPPLTFILLGATGDLAQKKIIPALVRLFAHKKLPESSRIIAFSRRPWGDDEYRSYITPWLEGITDVSAQQKKHFLDHITYIQGTFDTNEAYERLREKVDTEHVLIYFAVEPRFYEIIFTKLGAVGFGNKSKLKLLIEKPFGSHFTSAQHLETVLRQYFTEEQVYRIDHYLGKQGLIKLVHEKKKNKEFESTLNAKHIQSLAVTLIESLDIQDRGEFYEKVGALRDVGQNHILEMLAVTAMDTPIDEGYIPEARAQVIEALKPVTELTQVKRGQYEGYRSEHDVSPHSEVETYFKVQTEIEHERWRGVPVILQAGKAFKEKKIRDKNYIQRRLS